MRTVLVVLISGLLSVGQACSYARPDGDVQVMTTTSKRSAWLGVSLQDVTKKVAEKNDLSVREGALVTEVMEDSPAEKAGIEDGDVIVRLNDEAVGESEDLSNLVQKQKPGAEVELELVRKAEHKKIKVVLGKRPRNMTAGFAPFPNFAVTVPKVAPNVRVFVSGESDMLGFEMQELGKQLAEYFEVPGKKGVLVSEVEKGSDAAKAGFLAGDVITKVNGTNVGDVGEVVEEVHATKTGEQMTFDVIRKGKNVTMKLTKSDDEGDEDEDGYSYHFRNSDGSNNHFFESERDREQFRQEMSRLKEELGKMKYDLRDKLGKVRNAIVRELREL